MAKGLNDARALCNFASARQRQGFICFVSNLQGFRTNPVRHQASTDQLQSVKTSKKSESKKRVIIVLNISQVPFLHPLPFPLQLQYIIKLPSSLLSLSSWEVLPRAGGQKIVASFPPKRGQPGPLGKKCTQHLIDGLLHYKLLCLCSGVTSQKQYLCNENYPLRYGPSCARRISQKMCKIRWKLPASSLKQSGGETPWKWKTMGANAK